MDLDTVTKNAIETCKKNIIENTQKKFAELIVSINNAITTSLEQEFKFRITTNLQIISMLQEFFSKYDVNINIDQPQKVDGFSFGHNEQSNKQFVKEYVLVIRVPLT